MRANSSTRNNHFRLNRHFSATHEDLKSTISSNASRRYRMRSKENQSFDNGCQISGLRSQRDMTSPVPVQSEPEKDVKEVPKKKEMNIEDISSKENLDKSVEVLNGLLGNGPEESEISLGEKDPDNMMNDSAPQVEELQKILSKYKDDSGIDDSDMMEESVKESIKRTQEAYENIMKLKYGKKDEIEPKEVSKESTVNMETTLEKELGFCFESDVSQEENKKDNEEGSENSDDFPPDREIKRINAESSEVPVQKDISEDRKEIDKFLESSLSSHSKEASSNNEAPDFSDPQILHKKSVSEQIPDIVEAQMIKSPKSSMEDTMCKLVEYLDAEESPSKASKISQSPAPINEEPVREISLDTAPKLSEANLEVIANLKSSPIVEKLEKASKEQTFGNTTQEENLETIQVHNLEHLKKEELRTERKVNDGQLMKAEVVHDTHTTSQIMTNTTPKDSCDLNMYSNFDMTLRKNPDDRKSELDALMKGSEDYFNSVLNQMHQDLNPIPNRKHMSSEIPKPMRKTGKISKNKSKRVKRNLPNTSAQLGDPKFSSFSIEHKENISTNMGAKDVWYNVNRILEKNGYAKISISSKTDPALVCNTVLEILHDYEKRGETIQNLLTSKREFGYQNASQRATDIESKNKIASLQEANSKLKAKIKALEYSLQQNSQKSKRKEWSSKEDSVNSKGLILKLAMAQNQIKASEKEKLKLKEKLDKVTERIEKSERRDLDLPKNLPSRIKDMISGYENQKERLDGRISSLEVQIQKVNNINAKLINENKCLAKGSTQANSKYFYMKDEGKLLQKLEELEKVKDNLMKALTRKEETIETNLQELENIKEVKSAMTAKIQALEHDLKHGPSIAELHSLQNTITKLESECKRLRKENDTLENEVMMLKNNNNSHLKPQAESFSTKNSSRISYDEESATKILLKVLEILNIQNPFEKFSDEASFSILETVTKIQRVVMAVPRMEAFIKQVCSSVFPHTPSPQLENIIPEIHRLHSLIYSYQNKGA
ncbi:unnamed protein product [Moneuplotes crassus]|uniref:Centrosomal protein of 70 kDa n=1 Tax=Euplotes crassus TaxID=5936 RepID=A0AAD2D1P2_EUPCR|nr:unnamed protein product [Moneuplotes crassus]